MRAGRIEQMAEAEELYERPRTRFVAQFLGSCNLLEATVKQRGFSDAVVQTAIGELRVEWQGQPERVRREKFAIAIRPEKVQVRAANETNGDNRVKTRVEQLIYHGSETQYLLRAGEYQLKARVLNARPGGQGFEVGQEVTAELPRASLIVLED